MGEQGACEGDALALPARERAALLLDAPVEAAGHRVEHVARVGDTHRLEHLLARGVAAYVELEVERPGEQGRGRLGDDDALDRKSTRLNSIHVKTSYAVFCLKKKNKI